MKRIELIGLPGSGKTHYTKKISSKKIFNVFPSIFNCFNHLRILEVPFKEILSLYFLKIFSSTFFIETLDEKNSLIDRLKIFIKKKSLNVLINSIKDDENFISYRYYKRLVNLSSHLSYRKNRMLDYFIVEFYLLLKINSNNIFIFDEGFFQKILLEFRDFKKNEKKIFVFLEKYLKTCKKPDYIIFIKTKPKKCIERSNKRKIGYTYVEKDIKNNLKNWIKVSNFIEKYLKKRKIKNYKLNNLNKINYKLINQIKSL